VLLDMHQSHNKTITASQLMTNTPINTAITDKFKHYQVTSAETLGQDHSNDTEIHQSLQQSHHSP